MGRSSMSNRRKKRGGNVTSADTQITQLLLAASKIFLTHQPGDLTPGSRAALAAPRPCSRGVVGGCQVPPSARRGRLWGPWGLGGSVRSPTRGMGWRNGDGEGACRAARELAHKSCEHAWLCPSAPWSQLVLDEHLQCPGGICPGKWSVQSSRKSGFSPAPALPSTS